MLQLLAFLAATYVVVCALAFAFQRRLVYFPAGPPEATPADAGLAFEEVRLRTKDDVELHGWWIPAPDARGAVLVCHGNGGNVAGGLHHARVLHDMGLHVLLFDYRGYGLSGGQPNEEGLYEDAETAWRYLVEERGVPPARVAALGESLGGAVAIELATRRELGALLVESSFTTLPDVGSRAYPYLPVRWLARERFESLPKLSAVRCPMLFVHGRRDEIVPFAHGERLRDAAPAGTRLVEIAGGHNDGGFTAEPGALAAVREFLLDALGEAPLEAPGHSPGPPSNPSPK